MNNLVDAIAKAYEYGAGCQSAKVTIQIYNSANTAVHSMRRVDETVKTPEIRYVPSKWDPTQLTELLIAPAVAGATQTIFLRLRDKYQFNVGTSLTMRDLKFEMLDTHVYYDKENLKELNKCYKKK